MSQLGQLEIVGQLTPGSKTVRVRWQKIGANVVLSMHGALGAVRAIGGGLATWPDQTFPLTESLKEAFTVTAFQTEAGFPSPVATAKVGRAPEPEDLAKGAFALPIHACAKCVYLYGLWPGAEVEIRPGLSDRIGTAIVPEDGITTVHLDRELLVGEFLVAFVRWRSVSASSPIIAGVGSVLPTPPLPPPTIDPAIECDQFIRVSGIVPGAQVTVFRGGEKLGPACSPGGDITFIGIKRLRKPADNAIEALQAFPDDRCRLESPKGSTTLQDWTGIPTPTIQPLCEEATSIKLGGLRVGADVEVAVNGDMLIFGAALTTRSLPVAPLISPQTVTARQSACSPSRWSALASVLVNSSKPVPPKPYSPADGATGVALNATLSWSDPGTFCNHAAAFQLQVTTDQNFASGVLNYNGVTSLQWGILPPLLPNTTYFWRVRSQRGAVTTWWSSIMKFTTVQQAQEQPTDHSVPPPPSDVRRDRCFIEECPNSSKKIVHGFGTFNEAYDEVMGKKASTCTIAQFEVDCNTPLKEP